MVALVCLQINKESLEDGSGLDPTSIASHTSSRPAAPDKIVRCKNFFRLFRFILLLIDLTNLTLIHRKMLLIVLILHFLMIIAPSITTIDTPSSPILLLWIDTQYEILIRNFLKSKPNGGLVSGSYNFFL